MERQQGIAEETGRGSIARTKARNDRLTLLLFIVIVVYGLLIYEEDVCMK